MQFNPPGFENKIISLTKLINLAQTSPVVFTNGCFDIIHRGHVTYLAQAKSLGKTLIVALNSDNSVRRQNKSPERPINPLANRMAVIAALDSVDYVLSFDEDTPLNLILAIKPDILVKGGDWPIESIVGFKEVLSLGGQVYSIPFLYNTSTTKLVNQILSHGN